MTLTDRLLSLGSIPAWAGETDHRKSVVLIERVDPRVGGGDNVGIEDLTPGTGRSPRGRGRLGR